MLASSIKINYYYYYYLKHLSGLSYLCTLARYDFNFKQSLSCIHQGQYENTFVPHLLSLQPGQI